MFKFAIPSSPTYKLLVRNMICETPETKLVTYLIASAVQDLKRSCLYTKFDKYKFAAKKKNELFAARMRRRLTLKWIKNKHPNYSKWCSFIGVDSDFIAEVALKEVGLYYAQQRKKASRARIRARRLKH